MRHRTTSARTTRSLGEKCGKRIVARRPGTRAVVLALTGDIGAGKTTFMQGFFRGVGLSSRRAVSPTFIIMRRFSLPARQLYRSLYHIDAYRLEHPGAVRALGFAALIRDPRNIVCIEWAERLRPFLPRGTAWCRFYHGATESERFVTIPPLLRPQ